MSVIYEEGLTRICSTYKKLTIYEEKIKDGND